MALLVTLTNSNIWSAILALLTALLLAVRLYKEVKGLFIDSKED